MPDNFWGNVLINALGTIFGGVVLAAMLGYGAWRWRRISQIGEDKLLQRFWPRTPQVQIAGIVVGVSFVAVLLGSTFAPDVYATFKRHELPDQWTAWAVITATGLGVILLSGVLVVCLLVVALMRLLDHWIAVTFFPAEAKN